MRNEKQIYDMILKYAAANDHIRVVTLEGSRTNRHIPRDEFQDYDITFLVDDLAVFTADDSWLEVFGHRLIMQKPEAMELFPPEERGFSYLMIFDDYVKMDLSLVEVSELAEYLASDKLISVLLDKDDRIQHEVIPSDEDYHIHRPTAGEYDDCCNEFWNVTTYVVKGLCRRELLFAIDHMNEIMRKELLRMLSWKVGLRYGFGFSLGKNYKFLDQYVEAEVWKRLLTTYNMGSYKAMWQALFTCHALFRETSREVAAALQYSYPEYDRNITKYVQHYYERFGCGSDIDS